MILKIMKGLVPVILSMTFGSSVYAAPRCQSVFRITQNKNMNEVAEDFARLTLALDLAKVSVDKLKLQILEREYPRKKAEILKYLEENTEISSADFLVKVKKIIERIQAKDAKREQKEVEVRASSNVEYIVPGRVLEFNKVKPGQFVDQGFTISVTKPFEMMSTPLTQLGWGLLKIEMGETAEKQLAPSANKGDGVLMVRDIPLPIQPDYPVTNVSWTEAQYFIQRLNVLSRSEIPHVQKLLKALFVGHQKGDVYDFPTWAQWKLIRTDLGTYYGEFLPGINEANLIDYAHYGGWRNNYKDTQPVAEKKPWVVDGKEYFDLEGNVQVWARAGIEKVTSDLQDPLGVVNSFPQALGSNWSDYAHSMEQNSLRGWDIDKGNSAIGIRLVRTRQ